MSNWQLLNSDVKYRRPSVSHVSLGLAGISAQPPSVAQAWTPDPLIGKRESSHRSDPISKSGVVSWNVDLLLVLWLMGAEPICRLGLLACRRPFMPVHACATQTRRKSHPWCVSEAHGRCLIVHYAGNGSD